jgi:hypothetical protein
MSVLPLPRWWLARRSLLPSARTKGTEPEPIALTARSSNGSIAMSDAGAAIRRARRTNDPVSRCEACLFLTVQRYAESLFRTVFLAAFGSARFASSYSKNKLRRWASLSAERLVSSRQRKYASKVNVGVHDSITPKKIAWIVVIVPPFDSANLSAASPHAQRAIVVPMWQQRDHYMDRAAYVWAAKWPTRSGSALTLLCINDVFEDEVRQLDQKPSQPGILLKQRVYAVAPFVILK